MKLFIIMGMNRTTGRISIMDIYDNHYSSMVRVRQYREQKPNYNFWIEYRTAKESNKYDEEII